MSDGHNVSERDKKTGVRRYFYFNGPKAPPNPVVGCEWFDTTPGCQSTKWWNGERWEAKP